MSYFEELHPEMDRYLEGTASKEPEILRRLRKETYQKTTQPHMISGYLQGRLLSLISKIISPKNRQRSQRMAVCLPQLLCLYCNQYDPERSQRVRLSLKEY